MRGKKGVQGRVRDALMASRLKDIVFTHNALMDLGVERNWLHGCFDKWNYIKK